MTTYPEEASGGCMCGAVRYHVEGAPLSSIFLSLHELPQAYRRARRCPCRLPA